MAAVRRAPRLLATALLLAVVAGPVGPTRAAAADGVRVTSIPSGLAVYVGVEGDPDLTSESRRAGKTPLTLPPSSEKRLVAVEAPAGSTNLLRITDSVTMKMTMVGSKAKIHRVFELPADHKRLVVLMHARGLSRERQAALYPEGIFFAFDEEAATATLRARGLDGPTVAHAIDLLRRGGKVALHLRGTPDPGGEPVWREMLISLDEDDRVQVREVEVP